MPTTKLSNAAIEETEQENDRAAPLTERRRAWLGDAYEEQHALVAGMLRRGDILPESARELLQDVSVVLAEYVRDRAIPANAQAMFVRITAFVRGNHRRRRQHRPPMDHEAPLDDLPGSRPDGDRRVHMGECERIVAQILAVMPPAAGELIRLIDLEERSHADAAALVGRSVELVKKQHARALRKFEALALQYFCAPPGLDL